MIIIVCYREDDLIQTIMTEREIASYVQTDNAGKNRNLIRSFQTQCTTTTQPETWWVS